MDLVPALDSFADWVVDNRESHPVFLYFLLHLSNAATDSVAWVHSLLTSAGWAGVLAVAAALAWYMRRRRAQGRRPGRRRSRFPHAAAACWGCGSRRPRRSP